MIAKHKLTKANAVLVAAQINDLAANSEYPVVNGLAVSTSYVSGPALGNMETGELRVRVVWRLRLLQRGRGGRHLLVRHAVHPGGSAPGVYACSRTTELVGAGPSCPHQCSKGTPHGRPSLH